MAYKVRLMSDATYEVIELTPNKEYDQYDYYSDKFNEQKMHQGSLADCEAWIRLHEGGYM